MKPDQGMGDGLKIRVSGLSAGKHEYSLSVPPSDLQLDANFDSPVEVKVRLEKLVRQIIVRSEIATGASFSCDRCLADYRQQLAASYAIVYVEDDSEAGRFPPEDVRIMRNNATVIDLSDDVREMVLLSVPLKLLCAEECRGLCSSCGADLNKGECGCTREHAGGSIVPRQGLEKLLKH
jgi:uncharacterized protein